MGNRRDKRTMFPVSEVKVARRTASSDKTEDGIEKISYEKALRLHARRKADVKDNFKIPDASPQPSKTVPAPSRGRSARKSGSRNVADGLRGTRKELKLAATLAQAATGSSAASKDPLPHTPEGPVSAPGSRLQSQVKAQRKPAHEAMVPSISSISLKSVAGKIVTSLPSQDLCETEPATIAQSRRKAGKLTNSADNARIPRTDTHASRTKTASHDQVAALSPALRSEGQIGRELVPYEQQLSQRKATLSLRVTEEEFARLRERAEESGISVSAYMRSCVLEVESLRAQVKQAMVEMRALSAAPVLNHPAALRGNGAPVLSSAWFKGFFQSAAAFLHPFFPLRRSA